MLTIKEIAVDMLKPWEHNPRVNDHAVDSVANSIETFGFNVPILCDQNHTIIAGHTRWKAAKKLALDKVPVITIEMSDARRKAFSVADNKTSEIADWDFIKLRDILKELKNEDFDMLSIGFSKDEMRRLILEQRANEDTAPQVSDQQRTRKGDIWKLGEHTLLCGDSRDLVSVNAITDNKQVDHIFAGPPYFNQREYAQWTNYKDYVADMRRIAINCKEILKDGGVVMWNIANDCSSNIDLTGHNSRILEESGFSYLDTIIWLKTGGNFGNPRNFHIRRNGRYYPAFQWEALLVYQKPGEMPKMSRDGKCYMLKHQTNVWEIPSVTNQVETYGHTAVCPVEIPYRSMLAYSGEDALVFEPFGGSGTTLIAAEKAGRKAFLMEQHPAYCDIILARWEAYTSKPAMKMHNIIASSERLLSKEAG
jgi:DNA modification methylase